MDIKSTFKILVFCLFSTFASSLLFADTPLQTVSPKTVSPKTVAITQIIDHPAANSVREGVIAGLHDQGFKEGENLKIIYESAQGSPVTAAQIAKKFVALNPDVLIPISTASTQAMVKADEGYGIPIVFAAVTDPVGSGIIPSLDKPGGHITGATDSTPVKQQLALFKAILPNIKKLGVVYNPGDNSSVSPVKEARELCKEMNVTLIEATAFKTADVTGAIQQLIGQGVEAIFVPLDNTVLAAMDAVLKITFKHNVPVFTSDSDSVTQGALASTGYTHFDTGYKAGEMVAAVLHGKKPAEMPVAHSQSLNVYINSKTAQLLNIIFPQEVEKIAKRL